MPSQHEELPLSLSVPFSLLSDCLLILCCYSDLFPSLPPFITHPTSLPPSLPLSLSLPVLRRLLRRIGVCRERSLHSFHSIHNVLLKDWRKLKEARPQPQTSVASGYRGSVEKKKARKNTMPGCVIFFAAFQGVQYLLHAKFTLFHGLLQSYPVSLFLVFSLVPCLFSSLPKWSIKTQTKNNTSEGMGINLCLWASPTFHTFKRPYS